MFSQACVILFTGGGGLSQYMLGYHQPPPHRTRQAPAPSTRQAPPHQAGTNASLDQAGTCPPPPEQSILGDTVNERAVCILLECNLVNYSIPFGNFLKSFRSLLREKKFSFVTDHLYRILSTSNFSMRRKTTVFKYVYPG